ncbi:hypothetical protein M9435_004161 [Picochlorum sp. BPE23]|nr:hypothetical protein M9435_004161 [Picochlorum sp. BPE23]
MEETKMEGLTAEEAAVYDRQLRVWGVEAQQRLRSAKVLVLGCSGAAMEVIKNLALAGVGSIVLVDERTIGQVNQGNFLISSEMDENRLLSEASACSLREMNPLVKIDHSDKSLTDFLENEQVENFGIVLAFDLSSSDVDKVDSLCSAKSIPFACCICRGVSGWIFSNPQNHEYVVEESKENKNGEIVKNLKQKRITGIKFLEMLEQIQSAAPRRKSPMLDTLKICMKYELKVGRKVSSDDWEALHTDLKALASSEQNELALQSYIQEDFGIAPVLAVLGGILSNDVIKVISKKGDPSIDRLFVYSILDDAGWTGDPLLTYSNSHLTSGLNHIHAPHLYSEIQRESPTGVNRKRNRRAYRMGKVPVRLKEVVYTLSPFEQSVMSGLWKDMPHKTAHYMSKAREIGLWFVLPLSGVYWFCDDFKEKEKQEHRF